MKHLNTLLSLGALVWAPQLFAGSEEAVHGHVMADYYESCACDVICPCLFGGKPTQKECLGQGLHVIKEGMVDGVDLSGVLIHSAFKMGTWEKYTVSENATPEQMAAAKKLIKTELNSMGAEVVGISKGKIEHDLGKATVSFSTSDSKMVMEMIPGADGNPMVMTNHPMFPNYRVYRSVTNSHSSDQAVFSLSGTNAFISDKVVHLGD